MTNSGESSGEADSRLVFLTGDIDEATVKATIESVFRLNEIDAGKPIQLIINTHGGSVDEAFALYDAVRFSPAPVYTTGLGKIMSAGCLLLAAGAKGHRSIGRRARLMYHGGFEAMHGDVFAIENDLTEFKRQEKMYDVLLAKACGKTLKQVEALYKAKRMDRYMTAAEALRFGFVDKLLPE